VARRLVDANADSADGWSLLGQAALASGDLLTARRASTRAAQIEAAHTDYWVLLAYVCWRQQDYRAAVIALERVLRDRPDDLIALYLLGRSHEATGNARATQDCCRHALRLNPDCGWARQLLESGSVSVRPGTPPWLTPGGTARSP